MPLLSFVVLSYNYGRYLADCLDSILQQDSIDDFEVIVVDDASKDDSQVVAGWFAARDSRLRLVSHSRNSGHVATVTTGLKLARGAYVARIDADDRYRPWFAAEALSILVRYPEVGLVYGDAALIDDAGTVTGCSDRPHGGRDFRGTEFTGLLAKNFICAPTVLARREVWLDALPVPSDLAFHDWYFTLMAARRWDFQYISRVLADYRVHPSNLHTKIARDRTEETSIFRLLDKIFTETEATSQMEEQKQRVKRKVYGAQYLSLANKYFGFRMDTDARRCYLRALHYCPRYLLQPDVARHLAATMAGRRTYDFSKSVVRAALLRAARPR